MFFFKVATADKLYFLNFVSFIFRKSPPTATAC